MALVCSPGAVLYSLLTRVSVSDLRDVRRVEVDLPLSDTENLNKPKTQSAIGPPWLAPVDAWPSRPASPERRRTEAARRFWDERFDMVGLKEYE